MRAYVGISFPTNLSEVKLKGLVAISVDKGQQAGHLSLIAPSNVPFLVKGGGPFCGPQIFSFCT